MQQVTDPKPKRPEGAHPRGLITPPPEVLAAIERERAKHPADAFARAEEGLVNDWTVDYYYGHQAAEVLYRRTPNGPEVLAVGPVEINALTEGRRPERMAGLKVWTAG
jgi:hypothetical protein